jgi:hypothetical protein
VSRGRLRPVAASALTVWAVVGLVLGWLVRRVGESISGTAPVISWLHPVVVVLLAAIMVGTAWITWRQVQVHRERLEPHRAVNRLVLGRACALVGALLAGGYLGYAVSWLGLHGDPLAHTVLARAIIAAAAGAILCGAGVWLERACRVHEDQDEQG